MGRISNFHGQMRTQISFVVEGREHRATMLKEKTRHRVQSGVSPVTHSPPLEFLF